MTNTVKSTKILLLSILCCNLEGTGGGVKDKFKSCINKLCNNDPGETSSQNNDPIEPHDSPIHNCHIVMDTNGRKGIRWSDKLGNATAVYATRGRRRYMEDRYTIKVKGSFITFGIFDGHGGANMADHAANNLLSFIIGALEREHLESNFEQTIFDSIVQFNNDGIQLIPEVRGKYSGSTAVIGVVHGGKVYIANVGDSRAVVIHSDGRAENITRDHNANCLQERQRIINEFDGDVREVDGVWRVGGACAPSRALGDYDLRRCGMTAEADTFTIDLNDPTKEYIVLATDGVWDVIDNQGAAEIIVQNDRKREELFGAKQLAKKAIRKGSSDNVTVMVVKLAAIRAWLRQVAGH